MARSAGPSLEDRAYYRMDPPSRRAANAADRVMDLLSSFHHLRNSNRVLVEELRGSLGKMRELSIQLSNRHLVSPSLRASTKTRAVDLVTRLGLTQREEEVAVLLAQGKPNQAIARELSISAHTARHHTQRILAKLEVHSRGEAGAKIRAAIS
jgi:DNA-binding NarL/FixJ family response regulator